MYAWLLVSADFVMFLLTAVCLRNGSPKRFIRPWGPFLETPGNLTDPKSHFEMTVSRKVGCVLTYNEVHFDSLANDFTT